MVTSLSALPVQAYDASLDETDRRLLALLQQDARRTAVEMAELLSLSAPAVTRRIKRLEAARVIHGYTARIDHAKLGLGIEALIELRFTGNTRPVAMEAAIADVSEVVAVFTTSGSYDQLVWIRVRDISHLRSAIDTLRARPRVLDTRTHIVLASHLSSV